jgi:hypothetical protein
MNYRAAMIGGTLSIERQRTGGTIVTCQLQSSPAASLGSVRKRRSAKDHHPANTSSS